MDYRALNKISPPQAFPLPKIELPSTIFPRVDLNQGYSQIVMDSDSIPLTSFVIGDFKYEFLRMPFGLCNALRTFQRSILSLFRNNSFIKVYIDDILIHLKTEEEHVYHLKEFFKTIKTHHLSINFQKYNFWKSQVIYLGNVIDANGIRPDLSRVSSLLQIIPNNKRQIKSTFGQIN